MMHKNSLVKCIIAFLGIIFGGCDGAAQQPTGGEFPPTLPLWIVENDPNMTIFEREDLERDRKVGKMLVIPLYMDYRHEGTIDKLAIAHPFIYSQGEEIEEKLASFEQRNNLGRLILWIPGYFPGSIGKTFPWIPIINGKRMIVLELQQCTGLEAGQINAAMESLLTDGDFVIEKVITWKTRPPHSDTPTRVNEPYDFTRLVRSEIYEERFFRYGVAGEHVLWAFSPGTTIVNRLSADEKKMVAIFASQIAEKKNKPSSTNGKESSD